jgi:hypothetical protein
VLSFDHRWTFDDLRVAPGGLDAAAATDVLVSIARRSSRRSRAT